jgi:hypothetical protein
MWRSRQGEGGLAQARDERFFLPAGFMCFTVP